MAPPTPAVAVAERERGSPSSAKRRFPWLAIGFALLAMVISLAIWRAQRDSERAHASERLAVEAQAARNEISARIQAQVLTLERMARRWEALGPPGFPDFELDARLALDQYPGIRAVGFAGPDGRVRWAVGTGTVEALQNLPLGAEPRQAKALRTARERRQTSLSRPVELVLGGEGFLACVPVYENGAFAGSVVGWFAFEELFDHLLDANRIAPDYALRILDGNIELYHRGELPAGSEPRPRADALLQLHDVTWRLELWPLAAEPSRLPGAVLRAGLLLALLLGTAVHLADLARRRAAELAAAKTALEREMRQRTAAEQALMRSEEHYRQLFRRNPAGVYRTRLDGEVLDCNDAFAAMFGFASRADALVRRMPDLYCDASERAALLARLEQEEILRNVEVCLRRADGQPFWAVMSESLLAADVGPAIVEGTLIDVSERKQAQDELDNIFELSLDLLAVLGFDGRLRRVNPAWRRLLEADDELVGEPLLASIEPTDRAAVAEQLAAVREGGAESASFEARLRTRSGEQRWMLWNVIAVPRQALIVATGRDISERKGAEAQLQESERRYREIFERSQGLIYAHDQAGVLLSVNPATATALGYGGDELRGRNLRELLAAEARPQFDFYLQQTRAEAVTSGMMQVLTRAGETRVWLYRSSRLEDDRRGYVLVHAQDITEVKRTEEALRESESAVRALYRIVSSQELAFSDKVHALLDLGNQRFGLPLGVLARRAGERVEILAARSHAGAPARGASFPLATTAARHALGAENGIAVERLEEETADAVQGGAYLGLPLRVTGRVYGVLSFSGDPRREPFKPADMDFLQLMALWVSSELEREERGRESELLSETSDLLETCTTSDEGFAVLAGAGKRLFPERGGEILLIGEAGTDEVQPAARWNSHLPGEVPAMTPGDCWALRRGRAHLVNDTRTGLLCKHYGRPLPAAALCVPMMALGETLGVLYLRTAPRFVTETEARQPSVAPSRFTVDERRLAEAFADRGAMALANLRLRETLRRQSISDPLTGVYNRRYMEEALSREVRRASRRDAPLGIILLDIDHFKRFNDTWGHEAGDVLLRSLGELLRSRVRGEDIACRYGGEEFALILPEATLAAATRRAEELRGEAKQLRVEYNGQPLGPVSLSLGVAVFPDHGGAGDAVLRAADVALYEAKAAGRDRVVMANAPAPVAQPAIET